MPLLAVGALVAASCGDDGNEASSAVASSSECEVIDVESFVAAADSNAVEADHDEDEAESDDVDHDEDEAGYDAVEVDVGDVELAYRIEMSEFAYDCTLPPIPAGVAVGLEFVNIGAVEHEAVIGDMTAQDEAAQLMQAEASGEEADHAEGAPSILLDPGEVGQLAVMFDEPKDLIIGCHVAGHWEAGMSGDFEVAEA